MAKIIIGLVGCVCVGIAIWLQGRKKERLVKEVEQKKAFDLAYKERRKNENIAYAREIKEHYEKEQRNDLVKWLDSVDFVKGGK